MDASLESLCAASETVPLLHNGQHSRGPVPRARVLQPQAAPRQRVQRSQPVSILAVRWAPASPRGPEGGWWGHCATLPPLRGQRVGDGVTAPPRLPSGVRGCVMGSLNHPASPQGSEGGWWDHCATSPPLRGQRVHGGVTVPPHLPSGVRGWMVGSLHHLPPLGGHRVGGRVTVPGSAWQTPSFPPSSRAAGGWTWYQVQFRSVLCALALCQVSGGIQKHCPRTLLC